jgi:hypothetical protein
MHRNYKNVQQELRVTTTNQSWVEGKKWTGSNCQGGVERWTKRGVTKPTGRWWERERNGVGEWPWWRSPRERERSMHTQCPPPFHWPTSGALLKILSSSPSDKVKRLRLPPPSPSDTSPGRQPGHWPNPPAWKVGNLTFLIPLYFLTLFFTVLRILQGIIVPNHIFSQGMRFTNDNIYYGNLTA